jgi:hypothetical protein
MSANVPKDSPEKDKRHLLETKDTLGKGKGIFAKKNIPCGTLVLSEKPLLQAAIDPVSGAAAIGAA